MTGRFNIFIILYCLLKIELCSIKRVEIKALTFRKGKPKAQRNEKGKGN